jgi:hypothetical protein
LIMSAQFEAGLVADGMRVWAKGCYPEEAAVELLIRFSGGRFATPGRPWVVPCRRSGWYWCNPIEIRFHTVGVSEGERRVLEVVAALLGDEPVDLLDIATGLDRATLALVLAAIAHAGGSHHDVNWRTGARLDPLVGWPELAVQGPTLFDLGAVS